MAHLVELEDHPIRVNARGEWFHGTERLHPKVERLFQEHVSLDEAGEYILQLQWRRAPLEVADTPYLVRSMRCVTDAAGALAAVELIVSDGVTETLDPHTLMQNDDNVLYCRLTRAGRSVPCRFQPGQYHELALWADVDDEGPFLRVGAETVRFGEYDPGRPVVS